MAWLLGLADKAENFLDTIDQNTAAVLKKEKNEIDQEQLNQESVGLLSTKSLSYSPVNNISGQHVTMEKCLMKLAQASTSVIEETNTTNNVIKEDMNTSSITQVETSSSNAVIISPTSLDKIETINCNSELSQFDNVNSTHGTVCQTAVNIPHTENVINTSMNNNQTASMSNETEVQVKQHHNSLKQEYEYEFPANEYFTEVWKNLEENNQFLNRQQTDNQKEVDTLKEKIENLIMEKKLLLKEITELQLSIDRYRMELSSTRSELEQHRARASRTLQEKEKLIAELRSNANTRTDETILIEMNQLRQERKILREENREVCEQLRIVRQELLGTEMKLDKIKQESAEDKAHAQESIIVERRRRLDAEEDVKIHIEEIRSLKEELALLRNKFSAKSQRQEAEISRLRTQLSAMSTPCSEVESRLSVLTQTLVSKQQALENLTTERNALKLQLEKMEQEYRSLSNWRKNALYNNINDTDDAKAQIPIFLMETPFDTGVARRMKRAYSVLDTISIRTGVFLRRYPLARILVVIYMALLQFWVLIVLLSQSPEAH